MLNAYFNGTKPWTMAPLEKTAFWKEWGEEFYFLQLCCTYIHTTPQSGRGIHSTRLDTI